MEQRTIFIPRPGDTLANGAIVHAARYSPMNAHPDDVGKSWQILAEWTGLDDKFVVWTFNAADGSTFWGHYFNNLPDAQSYFLNVAGKP